MTHQEIERLRGAYDPELLRPGKVFDGRPMPDGYKLPPRVFWHLSARGKEFVIVECGLDDFRAFVPISGGELQNYLRPF